MTTKVTYACNGCGKPVDAAVAIQFAGTWQGQATVASGGEHQWHSCSHKCAAKHLREMAVAIEKRGEELAEEKRRYEAQVAPKPEERNPGSAPAK